MSAARSVVAAVALAAFAAQPAPPPASPAVRFHHLHYGVDDPGAAMGDAAARFGGVRTIVQGVGVGVQVGKEYVLFERRTAASRGNRDAAAVYRTARDWLRAQGLTVAPGSFSETVVGASAGGGRFEAPPSARLEHVAFAVDDLADVVSRVRAKPARLTGDVVRFTLPSGLDLEIVRDTDRPDTHWCPMHLDVRAAAAGSCPICGMPLVPIPPPRIGEYRLDVDVLPRPGGGAAGLRMSAREPDTAAPVASFLTVHDRPFHLFIVGRDLEYFAHVHPDVDADGRLLLTHALPAGEYMLIADFVPAGGTPQLVQRAIVTPGYEGPLFTAPRPLQPAPAEQIADGLRVRLETERLLPRRESRLTFVVSDAATGQPVTSLEPFLGAAGHLLIVDEALGTAMHGHPEGRFSGGPDVGFHPVFPAPGRYKLWLQVQRRGAVTTLPFVVVVP